MTKDPTIFFDHILESIALIEQYVSGVSEETFLSDTGIPGQGHPPTFDRR